MPIFNNRGPSNKGPSGSGRPSGGGRPGGGGGRPGGGGGGRPGGGGGGRPGGGGGGRPGGGRPGAGKPMGKPFGKKKAAKKKRSFGKKAAKKATFPNLENTGMEGLYFKDLIEAEQLVVMKLNDGKEVRGFVRYYDLDVISIGPEDGSPKMFVRKDGIRYMYEVEDE